jgi:hypothetical protein
LNKHESYSLADDKSTNPRLLHHLLSISFLPAIFISNRNAWNKPGLKVLDFVEFNFDGVERTPETGRKTMEFIPYADRTKPWQPEKIGFLRAPCPGPGYQSRRLSLQKGLITVVAEMGVTTVGSQESGCRRWALEWEEGALFPDPLWPEPARRAGAVFHPVFRETDPEPP